MSETKLAKSLRRISEAAKRKVRAKALESNQLPEEYEPRRGQMKFIEEASNAIRHNEVFLGSAPCGIGKSLGSLMAVLPNLGENKLWICFRTRSQLHIYLKELRALNRKLSAVSLYSKQDMCPLRMKGNLLYFDFLEECRRLKENCESSTKPYCRFYWNLIRKKTENERLALDCAQRILSPQETIRRMSKQGFCAYEALKRVLDRVNIFLGTYHYIFNPPIREALLKSFGVSLSNVYLIVDEAHNLPAFSRELLSDRLTQITLEGALRETEKFEHEVLQSVREYLGVLNYSIFERAQEALEKNELKQVDPQKIDDMFLDQCGVSGPEAVETLHEYGEHIREVRRELGQERIFSYNHRVGEFMENFFKKVGTKYIHLIQKGWGERIVLEVRSFDGREITDSVLEQARGSILMSGFLSPPKVYRDLTLYGKSGVHLQELDSPFPSENRLILVAEDVSSRFEKRTNKMLDKWKDYIEAISIANEGNMAIFFTSYELMNSILPLIKDSRKKIVEQRNTKSAAVIGQLRGSDDNALFGVMGGKFSEGMDYPDNILTCVVAVGLPYATWNVYQKALIHYFNNQFPGKGRTYAYLTPAILRLIQTCGRVHRSATDKGCIVILDERITRPGIKNQLPKYYQDEMKSSQSPMDCSKQIGKFWNNQNLRRQDLAHF